MTTTNNMKNENALTISVPDTETAQEHIYKKPSVFVISASHLTNRAPPRPAFDSSRSYCLQPNS